MIIARRRSVVTQLHRPAITYATLDQATAYRYALSNGNLTFFPTFNGVDYHSVARTTSAKSSGKYYFEVRLTAISIPSYFRIGVSLDTSTPLDISTNQALLYGNSNTGVGSGSVWSSVRCAVDITAGKVWIGSGTAWYGGTDPASGLSPRATFTPGATVRATIRGLFNDYYYGDMFDTGTIRLSPDTLEYATPTGFTAGWPA